MARTGRRRTRKTGWVYIVTNPAFPGACKVGRTTNPLKRLLEFNIGDPYRAYTYHSLFWTPNVAKAEKAVHAEIIGHRYPNSEWFFFHPDDVRIIARRVATELGGHDANQVRDRTNRSAR